jgi:hypothetical protein
VSLWRNVGTGSADEPEPMGNWIGLRLAQDGANRDAIGAWVEIRIGDKTQRREVTVGGGHAGGQLGWIHFGIGNAERATVTVTWPDGEAGQAQEVDANTFVILDRETGSVNEWDAGAK